MKWPVLFAMAVIFSVASIGLIASGCDSDTCGATCDTDEDCGSGYICYSDGLCDNEDHNCETESQQAINDQ